MPDIEFLFYLFLNSSNNSNKQLLKLKLSLHKFIRKEDVQSTVSSFISFISHSFGKIIFRIFQNQSLMFCILKVLCQVGTFENSASDLILNESNKKIDNAEADDSDLNSLVWAYINYDDRFAVLKDLVYMHPRLFNQKLLRTMVIKTLLSEMPHPKLIKDERDKRSRNKALFPSALQGVWGVPGRK